MRRTATPPTTVNITPETIRAAQRGRPALPPAEPVGPEYVGATPADMAAEELGMRSAVEAYAEERDLMNKLMGRIEMASAISKLTTVVSLQHLAHIKETKLYKALRGRKAIDKDGDEIPDVGTWDGFCRAIGCTASKVDEDLMNLRVFGDDALRALSAAGAGYRELRQLRKLPDDEKSALVEAAAAGDKDAFLDLAESLVAKHAKEKEALQKAAAEAKADYEALDKTLARTKERADQAERDLARAQHRLETSTPDEVGEALRLEVSGIGFHIEGRINTDLMAAFDALAEHAVQNDCSHDEFMSGVLFGIERTLLAVRNKHNVKDRPDGDERPEWTRPGFDADKVAAEALEKLGWTGHDNSPAN